MCMEVDSGACKSVIHIDDYKKLFASLPIEPVKINLKVVTGENVSIVGQIQVNVCYDSKCFVLPLVVLNGTSRFVPLFGRNWFNVFNPNWRNFLNQNVMISSINDSDAYTGSKKKIRRLIYAVNIPLRLKVSLKLCLRMCLIVVLKIIR